MFFLVMLNFRSSRGFIGKLQMSNRRHKGLIKEDVHVR